MFLRAIFTGALIGFTCTGIIRAVFFAFPVFAVAVVFLVGAITSFDFGLGTLGHPVFTIAAVVAAIWAAIIAFGYSRGRWPTVTASVVGLFYGLIYGRLAYEISGYDPIWGVAVGLICGFLAFRPIVSMRKRALDSADLEPGSMQVPRA